MPSSGLSDEARAWAIECLQSGTSPEVVLQGLVTSGWPMGAAAPAIRELCTALGIEAPYLHTPASLATDDLPEEVPVPDPLPQGGLPATVDAGDRRVSVLLAVNNPRIVVFGGLLSDAECDELIALAAPKLERSITVKDDDESGKSEVHESRTSDGMFFNRGANELIARIEARIAALCKWPVENGEGLQVLRYQPGAEYQAHHDYFNPKAPGSKHHLKFGGQRVATVIIYLRTPAVGGGTTFPDVGVEVAPVKGNAVFFSYSRPHASSLSLHAGAPVVEGEKWIATKWLRERANI